MKQKEKQSFEKLVRDGNFFCLFKGVKEKNYRGEEDHLGLLLMKYSMTKLQVLLNLGEKLEELLK